MAIRQRTINAEGKSLGRIASEAALFLQGKHAVDYAANSEDGDVVRVTNLGSAKFTGAKLDDKKRYSYSGYPGGLKTHTLRNDWAKNPAEVLRRIVWSMLPKNTLRKKQIDRLLVD